MKSEHSKMEYVRLTIEEYQTLIDSESVKHGKWLISSDGYYPYCSECNYKPKSREMTKFCAECGAKMDKELLNK